MTTNGISSGSNASLNSMRRRASFLNIIRRRNTCDQLQTVTEHAKNKGDGEEISFEHVFEDDYRPVKREMMIEKLPNEPFGAEFFVYQRAVFIACVIRDSPAFRAGLQFGDQVISISEQEAANIDLEAARLYLNATQCVTLQICDTPLSRLHVLYRESSREKWGFTFKSRIITDVKPGSPAHRARLPVDWGIIDVNGWNTLLMESRDVARLISKGAGLDGEGDVLELMVMPKLIMAEFQAYLVSVIANKPREVKQNLLEVNAVTTAPSRSLNSSLNDLRPSSPSSPWF